jgi:hypothetical protein
VLGLPTRRARLSSASVDSGMSEKSIRLSGIGFSLFLARLPGADGTDRLDAISYIYANCPCIVSCRDPSVVGQSAVAALSERRNSLRIQDRRSETAATKIRLTHYRSFALLRMTANGLRMTGWVVGSDVGTVREPPLPDLLFFARRPNDIWSQTLMFFAFFA